MIHPAQNKMVTCDFCGRKVAEITHFLFRERIKTCLSYTTVPFRRSDCKQTVQEMHICISCQEHIGAELILKKVKEI